MNKIILLHGALGSKTELEPLSNELKTLGFTTYSFSFSGHGETVYSGVFGIEQFAKELQEFIETNSLQSASVFGYSMGGYVALYLETLFPGRLKKIVTLGTKFNWNKESAEKEIKMLDENFLNAKAPHFVQKLKTLHGDKWTELLKQTANMMRILSENEFLPAGKLHHVKSRVLLGLGDKDKMVTFDETKEKSEQIPDAKMFTLTETAHGLETADVKILANRMKEFVE